MNSDSNIKKSIFSKTRKSKKICRKALKKNYKLLLICWFVTAVVSFAAFGIYIFLDFAAFFLDIPFDFFASGIGLYIVLPLMCGNIFVSKEIVRGRKVDIYSLFDGYFYQSKFWKWIACYIISLCPGWLVTVIFGEISGNVSRCFPFIQGGAAIYSSLIFEMITLVLLFANSCKSLYFLSLFRITDDSRDFFAKAEKRYKKRKKCFKRYVLSHLHYILILALATYFPVYATVIVFTVVLGYLALSITSFSGGFEVKLKKYKFRRTEKRYGTQ